MSQMKRVLPVVLHVSIVLSFGTEHEVVQPLGEVYVSLEMEMGLGSPMVIHIRGGKCESVKEEGVMTLRSGGGWEVSVYIGVYLCKKMSQ